MALEHMPKIKLVSKLEMAKQIAELEAALEKANAKFMVERKAKERYFYGWKAEASQWIQWETTAVAEGKRREQAEAENKRLQSALMTAQASDQYHAKCLAQAEAELEALKADSLSYWKLETKRAEDMLRLVFDTYGDWWPQSLSQFDVWLTDLRENVRAERGTK